MAVISSSVVSTSQRVSLILLLMCHVAFGPNAIINSMLDVLLVFLSNFPHPYHSSAP